MPSYCQVSDVLNDWPRFIQSLPNNITNAAIQQWIDIGKAEIRARFLRRSLDPDNPSSLGWSPPLVSLTTDQANILLKFNVAYARLRFGHAAFAQMSAGELKLVTEATREWESMIGNVDATGKRVGKEYILGNDGVYDALFTPSAAHVQVEPQFSGVAGADYDPRLINNQTMGTFFMFEKGQRY